MAKRPPADRGRPDQVPSTALAPDWWMIQDVCAYLGLDPSTWTSYTSRGQVPAAERRFGRSPVWRPNTIKNLAQERGWPTLD